MDAPSPESLHQRCLWELKRLRISEMLSRCALILIALGVALASPPASRSSQSLDRFDPDRVSSLIGRIMVHCNVLNHQVEHAYHEIAGKVESVMARMEGKTVCTTIREELYDVLTPVVDLFDRQCNEGHNFGPFAEYFARTLQEILITVCDSTGEEILETVHPCVNEGREQYTGCIADVTEAYEPIMSRIDDYAKTTSLTDVFCGFMKKSFEDCLKPPINNNCKLKKTREASFKFVDSLFRNCPGFYYPNGVEL